MFQGHCFILSYTVMYIFNFYQFCAFPDGKCHFPETSLHSAELALVCTAPLGLLLFSRMGAPGARSSTFLFLGLFLILEKKTKYSNTGAGVRTVSSCTSEVDTMLASHLCT